MRRAAGVLFGIALVAGLLVRIAVPPAAAATLPSGFADQAVATIGAPTSLAFTPDGRLLVTTQGGTVRVVKDGALLATPALTLPSTVICANSERGLLGIAIDPNFASNGFVFLYYTMKKTPTSPCDGTAVNRVSRFVMTGDTLGSESVLIDNIHSPNGNHNAGDLEFGKDGFLYVAVGDGGCDYAGGGCAGANDAARDRHVLLGKVLRVDRNGAIPASNPFTGMGTARCNMTGIATVGTWCQETFAWGLRNPFKFAFDPNATGTRFYINDVGQSAWEEIDDGIAGADYGWNVREGHCATGSTTNCGAPPAGMTNPIFDYGRGDTCGTITGGAFVPNGVWSATYQGKYLFADYLCGKIFRLDPATGGGFTRVDFVTDLGGSSATDLRFGPYGRTQALYYTSYASGGQVRRIIDTTTIPPLTVQGSAWHDNGLQNRTGAPGTTISAYGTALQANVQYRLVSSPAQTNPNSRCTVDPVPINPNVRLSNGRGFVAITSGPINRPPGTYDICFVTTDGTVASSPSGFTVL